VKQESFFNFFETVDMNEEQDEKNDEEK